MNEKNALPAVAEQSAVVPADRELVTREPAAAPVGVTAADVPQLVPAGPETAQSVSEGLAVSPLMPTQSPQTPAAPRPPRRMLRAIARWTVAVLVFGGLGAGAAFGITAPDRGDVPGLSTRSDGRWSYPRLTLPTLAADQPRPFTRTNVAEIHYADLRRLLVPAPSGATVDGKLNGGWVSVDRYVSEYAPNERGNLRKTLRDLAVRHIAARGWTMPDGTSSRVYLLQFESTSFAGRFVSSDIYAGFDAGVPLVAAPTTRLDEKWSAGTGMPETTSSVFFEPKPYGATQARQAYIEAGDTIALVVQERKGGMPVVPFHQTVVLQNQLLD